MKKNIFIAVACIIIGSFSFGLTTYADVDLSGMSFEELIALKAQINIAMWESEEWQEVTVPTGIYKVGEDIPAGKWSVFAPDGTNIYVKWGTEVDETGAKLKESDGSQNIVSPTSSSFVQDYDCTQLDIELYDGLYFYIDFGAAVFTPFSGKAELGFK